MVFAELACPAGTGGRLGPEELGELMADALAQVLTQVETFGGTVTSVSGNGLVAVFGAPMSHEDDPERALRAAFRAVRALRGRADGLSLRAGVETGPAVVGYIGPHLAGVPHYGAVGEVVGAAATLQSVTRPGSVLVGPATRATTASLFEWGPVEEVVVAAGAKPLRAQYLEGVRARPAGPSGRRPLAWSAPLVGRTAEMSVLRQALREVTSGRGSVLVISGEAGLGKTRLVHECRKLFLTWVGAVSGRLPLWLQGAGASYGSSQEYGLYQQLLSTWVGASLEEDDETAGRAALERALRATFASQEIEHHAPLLARVFGLAGHGSRHGHERAFVTHSRAAPERNVRGRKGSCFAAGRAWSHGHRPRRPALGRPHIAQADRTVGHHQPRGTPAARAHPSPGPRIPVFPPSSTALARPLVSTCGGQNWRPWPEGTSTTWFGACSAKPFQTTLSTRSVKAPEGTRSSRSNGWLRW